MSIKKIDDGLAKYYKVHGRDDYYNDTSTGKFEAACDENGFGEDDIAEELATTAEECMLLDFDVIGDINNFPGVNGNLEAILDILKKCLEGGKDTSFGTVRSSSATAEMKYTRKAYEISNQDEAAIGDQYRSQCPKSFLGAMIKDASTFKLMMVGQKANSPYIQNLVDDYLRCRVEEFLQTQKPLTVTQWMINHPHFKMLKNISKANVDLVTSAVKGFVQRICPVLLFQPVSKIQGSVLETATLIQSAIEFVNGVATSENQAKSNCPFQMDFCVGYDPMKSTVSGGDGDDDDDDDDDYDDDDDDDDVKQQGASGNSGSGVDVIGDIIKKLESNKGNGVTFVKGKNSDKRVIRDCYKAYQDKTKNESLQRQRIIGFVDKRSNPFKFDDEKDEKEAQKEGVHRMLVYSAPKDCNEIPANAVNEWFLSSSSMCLVPNEKYELQKMMKQDNGKGGAASTQAQAASTTELQNKNIGSKDNAAMITISFHVRSEESIACYIYAMGQYTRFMPRDIIDILPLMFDETYGNNGTFGSSWDKAAIPQMEKLLVDEQFDKFRENQCGRMKMKKMI